MAKADALTELVLEVFRLNGRLLAAGDVLVSPVGLSSARWQVLGAISVAHGPLTVSGLARSIGLARQSVQRVVDDLGEAGIVKLLPNPAHKRASLVAMTAKGEALYVAASARQRPWARAIAEGFAAKELERAVALLRSLRLRLEADEEGKNGR